MKWSIGNKIASGFGLGLAVLLVVGAVSYDSTTKVSSSAEWVRHTHEVLTGLEGLLSGIKDAETGQRGYVITGESRYLEPYNTARDLVDQKLNSVRSLHSDNPIQQQRLQALEPLVDSKFTELQTVIDLRKTKGFAAASQEILTDKGKNAMDAIRKVVNAMVSEETGLLDKRSAEEQDRSHRTVLTIILGVLDLICTPGRRWCLTDAEHCRTAPRGLRRGAEDCPGRLVRRDDVERSQDEVGVLAKAFAEMTESLGQMTRVAAQISKGTHRRGHT